jgi:hypothetical protein
MERRREQRKEGRKKRMRDERKEGENKGRKEGKSTLRIRNRKHWFRNLLQTVNYYI